LSDSGLEAIRMCTVRYGTVRYMYTACQSCDDDDDDDDVSVRWRRRCNCLLAASCSLERKRRRRWPALHSVRSVHLHLCLHCSVRRPALTQQRLHCTSLFRN